jgi:hypothetical protein
MRITVKAVCPVCGEVEMPNCDVWLKVCTNGPGLSTYGFQCPACHQPVERQACDRAVMQLISAGVSAEAWALPAELFEPHTGPPIGYDDLLDLALELADLDGSV